MNYFIDFIKKIAFSGFLLYGYNLVAVNFNMVIPINIITILIVLLLGSPGIFALVLFKIAVL